MTATPKLPTEVLDERRVSCPRSVEAFFARLTYEHTRFLDAIAEAAVSLEGESVVLAEDAACHARLAQQLLDAQRSIMRRRAEVTAMVARIGEVASADADALVDAARAEAEAMCGGVEEIFGADGWGVRASTQLDTRALMDDAREPEEQPGARAERQLRALLDEWWVLVQAETRTSIDDARGRAAVQTHLAEIEAGEIREVARALSALDEPSVGTDVTGDITNATIEVTDDVSADAIEPEADEPAPVSPPPMLIELGAAIDAADNAGLDALLASLLDALQVPPGVSTPDATDDEASNAAGPPASVEAIDPASRPSPAQEAFDHFWQAGPVSRRGGRRARDWVFVQVLRPMVAVVAMLALVLAWIG